MTYAKACRVASRPHCGHRGDLLLRRHRQVSRRRSGVISAFLFLGPKELRAPELVETLETLSPEIGLVVRAYDGGKTGTLETLFQLVKLQRRLCLIAPDAKPGFGQHIPRWQRAPMRQRSIVSMSVHNAREAIRARRAKAQVVFVSPLYPTQSHPGGDTLGVFQARRCAALFGGPAFALGGVDAQTVKASAHGFTGFAAISSLLAL